jgi:hypothetical protein
MAPIGRLRLRDGKLVVEGMAGEIHAQIEPDETMRIDDRTQLWKLVPGMSPAPASVAVEWTQMPDDDRGYIDAEEVIDVTPKEIEQ